MKYFSLLLGLRLKATLRSTAFLVSALCFLTLTVLFGILLPRQEQAGLTVGVLPESVIGKAAAELLLKNGDYQVVPYEDKAVMERDVLTGRLHCAYVLSDEWTEKHPVTVLSTEGAYLRPLMDQLVLSAYFHAKVPRMIGDYLGSLGYPGGEEEAAALIETERARSNAMEIVVRTIGSGEAMENGALKNGIQPLLYAVMVSLFVAVSLLGAMLSKEEDIRALGQLRALTGRKFSGVLAPALATALLYLALLWGTTLLLSVLLGPMSRGGGLLYLLLALAAAGFSMAGARLRRHAAVVGALLPIWLMVSVFCSGALLDPKLLPMGLSFLRFLSPAWYALRLL